MDDPNAAGQQFAIQEGFAGRELHLRSIAFRHIELALELVLIGRRFSLMVPIGDDNVIDRPAALDLFHIVRCHGRRIDEDPMFADGQQQPVEVELLLLREPGPLPHTGKQLLHGKTARLARQARGARLVAESIGFLLLFHVAPFPPVPFVTPLQSAATASLTTFVTFARMSASLERSIMSSSGMVMNLRLGPLVREIRNMLLDGVTGITTCTAASIPFTRSRNFCFPTSSSSIVTLYPAPQERWSAPSNFGVKVAGLSPYCAHR